MDIITYSLKSDQPRSDRYYHDIAAFTDSVLAQSEADFQPLIAAFTVFLRQTEREVPRTWAEYFFELLTLAVFWRVYAFRALHLTRLPQQALTALAHVRQRGGIFKTGADAIRGTLITLYLGLNGHRKRGHVPLTLDGLDRLIAWLAATGDFEQEVKRLDSWREYFATLPTPVAQTHSKAIVALGDWFDAYSESVLDRYTPNVDQFLRDTHPNYRWREDMIFCGRQRVEYHLNMVGTEIMNRAFRDTFLATGRKVVLVPPCMRARPAERCEARPTPIGEQCAGCEPGCRIHQVTKLGEKHGFAVFILPRELAALSPSRSTQDGMTGMGIVGVSCPLTNPQGGWKTRDMDLPAQGLLLDYCGCSWHWHLDGGIPTEINLNQLLRVLNIGHASNNRNYGETPVPVMKAADDTGAARMKSNG